MPTSPSSIAAVIRNRVASPRTVRVWNPEDFADLGPRTVVDQVLHRLVASGKLRRIARGLYDLPDTNRLTGKPTSPDSRAVIDALARKNNVRVLVNGITAANHLGLTEAVPARITVFTDARQRPITLGKLTIKLSRRYAQPPLLGGPPRHALRAGARLTARHAPLRRRTAPAPASLDSPRPRSIMGEQSETICAAVSALREWMRKIIRELLRE
jgi:hypothetical protein